MTGSEYKALRQLLGMTRLQAAAFHGVRNLRTIYRWETDYSVISNVAASNIIKLFIWSCREVMRCVHEAEEGKTMREHLFVLPEEVRPLPYSVYEAIFARTYGYCLAHHIPCKIGS